MPDNRIRFSAPKIDFEAEVGLTGQAHDDYPAPGQQIRYDWMRSYLIGLLANQSGQTAPAQCRTGTLWYDTSVNAFKVKTTEGWVSAAEAIVLNDDGLTLADLYATMTALLNSAPTVSFGGLSVNNGVALLPVPESLRQYVVFGSRPLVWINGVMLDPRTVRYTSGAEGIDLLDDTLSSGDRYTVLMLNVGHFHVADVNV